MNSESKKIAIIGTGPAGLMVADWLTQALQGSPFEIKLFEKRPAAGRKLLIAGSSGLNVGSSEDWHSAYKPIQPLAPILNFFPPEQWIQFLDNLGMKPFLGTSRRYFIATPQMKAAPLLKAWVDRLEKRGVQFYYNHEWSGIQFDYSSPQRPITLEFLNTRSSDSKTTVFDQFDYVCIALGGGSWEPTETPLRWPDLFKHYNIKLNPFLAANVGYECDWPEALLKEAEGKPIKNILFTTSLGSKKGELVITKYGLEGTPIYTLGTVQTATIDFKPDESVESLLEKLHEKRARTLKNFSAMRSVKKYLGLSEGALALIFHLAPKNTLQSLDTLIPLIKNFPIPLLRPRPLSEAISSSGGVEWSELTAELELIKWPRVFLAGEMIDWHAPTGGFLIQGCAALGAFAGNQIATRIKNPKEY